MSGDPSCQSVLVRNKLKVWERNFFIRNGRKPNKEDIRSDLSILNLYKDYRAKKNSICENTCNVALSVELQRVQSENLCTSESFGSDRRCDTHQPSHSSISNEDLVGEQSYLSQQSESTDFIILRQRSGNFDSTTGHGQDVSFQASFSRGLVCLKVPATNLAKQLLSNSTSLRQGCTKLSQGVESKNVSDSTYQRDFLTEVQAASGTTLERTAPSVASLVQSANNLPHISIVRGHEIEETFASSFFQEITGSEGCSGYQDTVGAVKVSEGKEDVCTVRKRSRDGDWVKPSSSGIKFISTKRNSKPRGVGKIRAGKEDQAHRENFVRLNLGRGKGRLKNGTGIRKGGCGGGKRRYGFMRTKNGKKASSVPADGCEINTVEEDSPLHEVDTRAIYESKVSSLWQDEGWHTGAERPTSPGCHTEISKIDVSTTIEHAECSRLGGSTRKLDTEPCLDEALHKVFGFPAFREGQRDAIQRVMNKLSTLLILPTGAGKSLCYQLPAYLLPGVALVISPLVALMVDQLNHLPESLPGGLLSSCQSMKESNDVMSRLRQGQLKVLFLSPERLCSEAFLNAIGEIPEISFAVVDEAHCLSEWSHNFRSSYFRLGRLLKERLKVACVLAMTATATLATRNSILDALNIPVEGMILSSNVRANLALSVRSSTDRKGKILGILQELPCKEAQSIIVYCTFQADADDLAKYLTAKGIPAKSYHGGKYSNERTRIQELFCANKLRVVVATVAFGMGLDKRDIRAVIHYGIPRSLEQYVQEIGRAGRDGEPAHCQMFLDKSDYLKIRSLAHSEGADESSIHKFFCRVFEPCQPKRGSRDYATDNQRVISVIPIGKASVEFDMKEEVMVTMLTYLEGGEKPYLCILSNMKTTCDLTFHRRSAEALADSNPLVAAIIKCGSTKGGHWIFDVPRVAFELGESLFTVNYELQNLQACGDVFCELRDPALCFVLLRAPPDLGALSSAMAAKMAAMERCKVQKIDTMYYAAAAALEQNGFPSAGGAALLTSIDRYFNAPEGSAPSEASTINRTATPFLRADIKIFARINAHVRLTGRAVARILHGIWSPAFPYSAWHKSHFWGRYSTTDFHEVRRIATEELLLARAKSDEDL